MINSRLASLLNSIFLSNMQIWGMNVPTDIVICHSSCIPIPIDIFHRPCRAFPLVPHSTTVAVFSISSRSKFSGILIPISVVLFSVSLSIPVSFRARITRTCSTQSTTMSERASAEKFMLPVAWMKSETILLRILSFKHSHWFKIKL